MKRSLLAVFALAAPLTLAVPAQAGKPAPSAGLYPDLRAVIPQHLQLVNSHQREILRFSNGVANTGPGHLALRPDFQPTVTNAIQEIRDADGNVVEEFLTSQYEFHPEHNHWHIGQVALFEVRKGSPTGPTVGGNSIKVTFCLIDWYMLDDNANTKERNFWDCFASYQGISSGWVDQYHQSTEGQQLDLTGIPNADDYYLVTTSNPDGIFRETTLANNSAWVSFSLGQGSKGNRKVTVTGHSPCDSPGLCGEVTTNR
jgi:hypothetical protein